MLGGIEGRGHAAHCIAHNFHENKTYFISFGSLRDWFMCYYEQKNDEIFSQIILRTLMHTNKWLKCDCKHQRNWRKKKVIWLFATSFVPSKTKIICHFPWHRFVGLRSLPMISLGKHSTFTFWIKRRRLLLDVTFVVATFFSSSTSFFIVSIFIQEKVTLFITAL